MMFETILAFIACAAGIWFACKFINRACENHWYRRREKENAEKYGYGDPK
jgi:hypothetical protein